MSLNNFDSEEAKNFLIEREKRENQLKENERQRLLKKVTSILNNEFKNSDVTVYLVGSIIRPFSFTLQSDIDIVVKNYTGDRFDFWIRMETEMGRKVEVILFETCSFQEFILREGIKVI